MYMFGIQHFMNLTIFETQAFVLKKVCCSLTFWKWKAAKTVFGLLKYLIFHEENYIVGYSTVYTYSKVLRKLENRKEPMFSFRQNWESDQLVKTFMF